MRAGLENLVIAGVPAHPLVVHAVVVGVPVLAVAGSVMLARSAWRRSWAWPLAVMVALLVPVAFLARETGQGLQRGLGGGIAEQHAEYGLLAPFFVTAMALGCLAFAVLRTRGRAAGITGGGLLVLTSVAAVAWVVVTGHSGADSSWGGVTLG